MLTGVFTLFYNANNARGNGPKVIVKNLEGKTGLLYIGLYNNAPAFTAKKEAVFFKTVRFTGQTEVIVSFDAIPAGNYAIAAFLDENGNGVMDKNLLGIPKEKYGFSNNPAPAMRAAKFEEAAFELVSGAQTIGIKLK
jgi:uncharacterized protein (DUF2141 family)